MKIRLFVFVLGFACLLSEVKTQSCNLEGGNRNTQFPDILEKTAYSYVMGVEYTVPGASQTDYFTEYYEYEFERGRIDAHIAKQNLRYIYLSQSWEAWNIEIDGDKCELLNITDTPDIFKDGQTEWVHSNGTERFTTVGPSAMFKVAYDEWAKNTPNMMFMGRSNETVRGENAVFFRRCKDNGYIDYFFSAKGEENPFDINGENITPLRVAFYNISYSIKEMAIQYYDIMSFQHEIPNGIEPFELPKGRNCKRGYLADDKPLPDFSSNNMLLSAEVIYKKVEKKDEKVVSSYYSTLTFAIDREIQHIAYVYSSWNTTKPDKDHTEPFVNAPHYIIHDLKQNYTYKINYETVTCTIAREKRFIPTYKLPENGGGVGLTDPIVLFPNNELSYLTEGTNRGLKVNIFEAELKGYMLDPKTPIERLIVSHSYFTVNEIVENAAVVKTAPAQIEMQLFRDANSNYKEVLTFNIFGFTTKLPKERYLFDISRCFLNEEDYSYVTLGFQPEARYLPALIKRLPEVEDKVIKLTTLKSELNVVRIPSVWTDVKKDTIFVTMLILGKPPVVLDYLEPEEKKNLVSLSPNDIESVATFDTCANNCLETRSFCWGFSICGATCHYGTEKNETTESKDDCKLYRRVTNTSFIQSKELLVNNIAGQVEAGEFFTSIFIESEQVELKATIVQINEPAADDSLLNKMGNVLNPRMRVSKSATKLKTGSQIKNLGKLRYDECQKLCLDYKECESLSFCLINSECRISTKFAIDLKGADLESDNLCILLARKYADHFDRTPGIFITVDGGTKVDNAPTVEDCARACMRQDKFQCLSFDHCAGGEKDGCRLYTTHYLLGKTAEAAENKNARCGHYSRKLSTEFKKKAETRIIGKTFEIISNLTMEECAKRCIEYDRGSCYGYDFCQDGLLSTSCSLIDSDPSRLKTSYSPICTNYARTSPEYAPRPFSNAYAGGIGFLCFLIGGIIGALIVFVVAYIRVNRG